jgi:hypothetical protein
VSNLKDETLEELSEHNKTVDDIVWVGSRDGVIPVDEFLREADFAYDDDFGLAEVARDLVVAGTDWCLYRHEYDGAEWWEFLDLSAPNRRLKNYSLFSGGKLEVRSAERW